jgi:hypothetical protein
MMEAVCYSEVSSNFYQAIKHEYKYHFTEERLLGYKCAAKKAYSFTKTDDKLLTV